MVKSHYISQKATYQTTMSCIVFTTPKINVIIFPLTVTLYRHRQKAHGQFIDTLVDRILEHCGHSAVCPS